MRCSLCAENRYSKVPDALIVFSNPTHIGWAVWALQLQQRDQLLPRVSRTVCSHWGNEWKAAAFWRRRKKYCLPRLWPSREEPPSPELCDCHCGQHQGCLSPADLQLVGRKHHMAVLMVPEPFRKHTDSSRGSDTQDNSCGWALLLHTAGTTPSCQSKGGAVLSHAAAPAGSHLSWCGQAALLTHWSVQSSPLLSNEHASYSPTKLQTLWHPKREISSAVAIPKGQLSLFPGGKWGTPYLPILQTPGPVLAALSTATAMETVVMTVWRQAGVFATFITKKYAWLGFPKSCWLQRDSFALKFIFEASKPWKCSNSHVMGVGGQHKMRSGNYWQGNPCTKDATETSGASLNYCNCLVGFVWFCFLIKTIFSINTEEILLNFYLLFWRLLHHVITLNFRICQCKMIFCQHQNIWRTLADIFACKCVWGAFTHLFAWKKYGFNWLLSCSVFRRDYQNTGWEAEHKAWKETRGELSYRNNLVYQTRLACTSPSHCRATCISLHHFILQGQREKGPLFSRKRWAWPQKAPASLSCFAWERSSSSKGGWRGEAEKRSCRARSVCLIPCV